MGVVFFLSLPFMGVMLFPSFMLGSTSGGGVTLFVPPFLFFIFLSPPLLSSSPSFSSFFSHLILPFSLSFRTNSFHPFFFFSSFPSLFFPSPSFHSFFLLFIFVCLFFLEGIAYIVCFRDVIDGTTDCN